MRDLQIGMDLERSIEKVKPWLLGIFALGFIAIGAGAITLALKQQDGTNLFILGISIAGGIALVAYASYNLGRQKVQCEVLTTLHSKPK